MTFYIHDSKMEADLAKHFCDKWIDEQGLPKTEEDLLNFSNYAVGMTMLAIEQQDPSVKGLKREIVVRDRDNYRIGEKGLFFDCSPEEALDKYERGDLSGMSKSVCTDVGKFEVASESAYWKYYIPASCLFNFE